MVNFHRKYYDNGLGFPESLKRPTRPTTLSKDGTAFQFRHNEYENDQGKLIDDFYGAGCYALKNSYERKKRFHFEIKKMRLNLGNGRKSEFEVKGRARYTFMKANTISHLKKQFYDLELCQSSYTIQNGQVLFQTPLKIAEIFDNNYPDVLVKKLKLIETTEKKKDGKSRREQHRTERSKCTADIRLGGKMMCLIIKN